MSDPIPADALRLTIEVGPDHQPTDRLRAALDELVAALAEADADEVSGFAFEAPSLSWDAGVSTSILVSPSARKPIKGGNNEYFQYKLSDVIVSS